MLEVFSDPVALAKSFAPNHLAPSRSREECPSEFDSRSFSFLRTLMEKVGQDDSALQELFDAAITGFNKASVAGPIASPIVCRFFLTLIGSEALFDPTHMPVVLSSCIAFNELKEFD